MAFYPIFLIFITFVCIKLHDNNFRPIVWLWKPFHRYFVHFRRSWDSKASIINTFTTFLLLSFSKILFVSFTLLYFIHVRMLSNTNIARRCVLYYDPTVECHTKDHSMFVAIAVCVLVVFIFFPTILLIFYPTKLFRKCISYCGFRRWRALHMFVESFQGQYKDGTNGTRDFRMVSATFLILRILTLPSFLFRHHYFWSSSEVQCALFVITSCFFATMRPYKSNLRNNVDTVMLGVLALLSLGFLTETNYPGTVSSTKSILLTTLLLGIPHMVLILYICYVLAKKANITRCLTRKYDSLKRRVLAVCCTSQAEAEVDVESDTGSLPDRLVNPGEYEPVPPTTEEHTAAEENKETVSETPRRLTPVYTYGSIY